MLQVLGQMDVPLKIATTATWQLAQSTITSEIRSERRRVVGDDIVSRLRRMDATIPSVDPDKYVSPTEAADEIEYLRSEMENVNSEYNKLWRKYEQALKDNSTLIHVCQDPEGKWVRGD